MKHVAFFGIGWMTLWLAACDSEQSATTAAPNRRDAEGPAFGGLDAAVEADAGVEVAAVPAIYTFTNGCFMVRDAEGRWLAPSEGEAAFAFLTVEVQGASRFFMQASDLGTYLLYDRNRGYLVSEDGPLRRELSLQSDILTLDDGYVSGAEWELQSTDSSDEFRFQHRKTGSFLGSKGLVAAASSAATLSFEPASDCAEHPELTVDAEGQVTRGTFEDGAVFGIADTHSHILSNFAFGGGGIFHGAPFHRLGVEHALPDCEPFHGSMGRRDFFGFGFDGGTELLPALLIGELLEDNHRTDGYPNFTDWPNAPSSATHQTQYYRWLERAYLSGLRLVVQHATSNEIICDLMAGQGYQDVRYSCNDMVAVDRIIDETYAMERYIDAQAGGPGRGFLRVVDSPARAREVIREGKMAVVLGIEASNLFDCFSVPREGLPTCDPATVRAKLDAYYARGIRALFPVHKYDNAFSAGDGDRGFVELGNFLNSGHWSNFVQDCPSGISAVFDQGAVELGGLNEPRDEFLSTPPNDMSRFAEQPLLTLAPHLSRLQEGSLEGDYCQGAGLTELGEVLLREMMVRGMIIEIDHFSVRSYQQAFELLEENDYPPAATHGSTFDGRIYKLGGVSKTNLGRCRDPERPGAMLDELQERVKLIEANGGYPAEGLGLDLNGFAGAAGPRFGDLSACDSAQQGELTYPFASYSGEVTFTQPRVGNRTLDFNTEGLVHVGLLPELLEDARRDAESDADLEPLFRSAEAYIRMWERAEERGAALRAAR